MKKQKPNASFIILIALFILTQMTFALTNILPTRLTQDENADNFAASDNGVLEATNDVEEVVDTQELMALAAAPAKQILSLSALASVPKPSTAPQTASVAQQETKPVVRYVNANSLNVRESPNSESKLITEIERGDKVTYYETEGEWARIITWTDKKGYILAKYLVDTEKDVQKIVASTATSKKTSNVSRSSESTASSEPASAEALSLADKVVAYAKTLQGVKYVHGGYSTSGLDCSGLTKYVFAKYGITLPRSSSAYSGIGTKVARSDLMAGDILLFDGWGNKTLNHVGIYIGDGSFIHASTTKGKVVVQNLNAYRGTYLGARRVIK